MNLISFPNSKFLEFVNKPPDENPHNDFRKGVEFLCHFCSNFDRSVPLFLWFHFSFSRIFCGILFNTIMASQRGQINAKGNLQMRDNITGDNAHISNTEHNQTVGHSSVAKNEGTVNYQQGTTTNYSGHFQNTPIVHSTGAGSVKQNVTYGPTTNYGGLPQPNPTVGKTLNEGEGGKVPLEQLPEKERVIKDKFLSVSFLLKGASVQDCICKIYVEDSPEGPYSATGFLVSKNILLTNHHVFPDASWVDSAIAIFGYNDSHNNPSLKSVPISEFVASDEGLDFALVKIAQEMPSFISLPKNPLKYAKGQYANIIGHPDGKPKMVSLRSNKISEVMENAIEYTSDTEPGSSGSPVFDNSWKLIALHSSAGRQDGHGNWISNKGIRIDSIVAHIKANGLIPV